MMRVPDHVLNSIVFLGYNEQPGNQSTGRFAGSGCIVGVELAELLFLYLVTADHNAKQLNNYPDGFARVNNIEGNGYIIPIERKGFGSSAIDPWFRHPTDSSADVAVQIFIPPEVESGESEFSKRSVAYIPDKMFVRDEQFTQKGLGIGDEVFVSGLFHFMQGTDSNSPIPRVGNIAMLPKEKVKGGKDYGLMDAVLIEVQSIGGLSGSPVFVRPTVDVAKGRRRSLRRAAAAKATSADFYLLGIIHGHWDDSHAFSQRANGYDDQSVTLSNGISIATPAKKIRETLFQSRLCQQREEFVKSVAACSNNVEPPPRSNLSR